MSLLELGGKQFTIPVGEVALGSDANCAIPLSGAGVLPRHVVLERQPDGQVVIRKATPQAEVLVNGVRRQTGSGWLRAHFRGRTPRRDDAVRREGGAARAEGGSPRQGCAGAGSDPQYRRAGREPHRRARVCDERRLARVRAGGGVRRGGAGDRRLAAPRRDRADGAGLPTRGLEHQRYVRERGARPGAADPPAGRRHPDWRAGLPLLCGRRPGGRAPRAAGGSGRRDSPGRAGSPRRR